MDQLALDLHAAAPPSLDNFVPGRNAEALGLLRALRDGARERRFAYLWGLPGCGRSHLLQALAGAGRLLGPGSPPEAFAWDPACELYLADDVHLLEEAGQHALFHLFNQVLADPRCALVAAGDAPPLGLALREDLRTRLGSALVYELHLLSDEEKVDAVHRVAADRGVALAPDVVPWLMTHRSRDLRALLATFDALDRYAYEHKRALTLPLVREWLQRSLDA
jgi:DnaA family protein